MGSTRKGMLNVLIAAVLWGSSGVCAQYIMEKSHISSPYLTMVRLLFTGVILLTLSFVHGDKIFSVIKHRKDALSLLIFSLVGALTVQLTFLLTIEKSNAATATVLQFLSPTIIVAWFALARKKRPGVFVLSAIVTSLVGTFLLVTHGDPTSLSISPAALFFGIASAFAAAFYTTYPSTLIARYGTLPIVGWSMLLGGAMMLPLGLCAFLVGLQGLIVGRAQRRVHEGGYPGHVDVRPVRVCAIEHQHAPRIEAGLLAGQRAGGDDFPVEEQRFHAAHGAAELVVLHDFQQAARAAYSRFSA